jgi:hypothetical protein
MGLGKLTVRKVCRQAEHTGTGGRQAEHTGTGGRQAKHTGTGGRQAGHTRTGGRQTEHIGPCWALGRVVGRATIVCGLIILGCHTMTGPAHCGCWRC